MVEKGNTKQIEEKIEMLLNDKPKSKQMGIKGREFVKDKFEWDIIAKKFLESTKDLIKN